MVQVHRGKPKVHIPSGDEFSRINRTLKENQLITVCAEARCPNQHECWNLGTATFMILGDTCTRSCAFCNVKTGRPAPPDPDEPGRVADAVMEMGIRHAVITSVDRDDLPDGGAEQFAELIRQIRQRDPRITIELLIPDFKGDPDALEIVMRERPDVLNHNVETVPDLYRKVRPQGNYQQSLTLLQRVADYGLYAKSGLMVGLGETENQVKFLLDDLLAHGCKFATIGQYLQPSRNHLPVARYVSDEEFARYEQYGRETGFHRFQSGPLVRSSYHAVDFRS